jgi:hypothetical protein
MKFGQRQMFALGRLKSGVMNKLESAYSDHLRLRQHAGEILWYKFEAIKLRLADNTFYTPDFFVMLADGEFQAHECKGWIMEDANVKLKVVAESFPLRFFVIKAQLKRDGGGFTINEV